MIIDKDCLNCVYVHMPKSVKPCNNCLKGEEFIPNKETFEQIERYLSYLKRTRIF